MRIILASFLICILYASKEANARPGFPQTADDWVHYHEYPALYAWKNIDNSAILTNISGLDESYDLSSNHMYAGYLTTEHTKHLYYWFNRAKDPESKTLVVWLNGGPGCSSLWGLFEEHGPLKLNRETGKLVEREHTWTRFAHTLYLDAPVGAGFSYDTNRENQTLTDETTITAIKGALERFFRKFRRYQDVDVYLAGESYAGMIIPKLALRLLKTKISPFYSGRRINVKGIILGNPLLNDELERKTLPSFLYYNGLIGKYTYEFFQENCSNKTKLETDPVLKQKCEKEGLKLLEFQYSEFSSLNIYDVTSDCWRANQSRVDQFLEDVYNFDEEGKTPEEIKAIRTIPEWIRKRPRCEASEGMDTFWNERLSRPEMKKSINAKFSEFKVCRDLKYRQSIIGMESYIRELVTTANKTVLLYYGDQDAVCNFVSGQEFVTGLGLEMTSTYKPFFITSADGKENVGGYSQEFVNRLKFATIKGAGHMAPSDKPEATYNLISNWIASNRDN